MEEVYEILRGKVVEGFEDEEQDLKRNAIFNGKPVKMLLDRGYRTFGRGSGNDVSSRVFDRLEFIDRFCR